MVDLWQQLVKQALVGTSRQPPVIPRVEGDLGAALAALEGSSPEARLLGAAALVSMTRRAGPLPARIEAALPEVAPEETLPRCIPAAADRLERILTGPFRELLLEWLTAAAAAGRRVPEQLLPRLLEEARGRKEVHSAVDPVLGARGRWLAGQHPHWRELGAAKVLASWETGTRAERLALLEQARREDPALARGWVASTWRDDAPEDIAAFLELFRIGLSLEDEPLLEQGLDHRRKEVRKVAGEMLASMPGSRLVARMVDRLKPLLRWVDGPKPHLEVELPPACDKAMARDGIEAKAQRSLGQGAWWLFQMLAIVPPAAWCDHFDATPAGLVAAARGEWERVVLDAWAEAAMRHRDADWALVLMEEWLSLNPASGLDRLAEVVPPDRLEPVILDLLETGSGLWPSSHPSRLLLRRHRHPWSQALSQAVVTRLRAHISARGAESDWNLRTHLREFALYIHPLIAEEAASGWSMAGIDRFVWGNIVSDFVDLLQFRHDMLEELAR